MPAGDLVDNVHAEAYKSPTVTEERKTMTSNYVAIRDDSGLKSLSVNERDFLRSCALRGVVLDDGDGDDDHHTTNRPMMVDDHDVGGGHYHHQQQQDQHKVLRYDGRRGSDVRKVRLNLQRWDNGSECTVQWGSGTRITATCTAQLVPPSSPDRPAEGVVNFTVDISPMAGSGLKLAPPVSTAGGSSAGVGQGGSQNHSDSSQRLLSNRILRCLERIVLIGGALDTEALVLQAGKWVWRITVSLTVLDAGGNLLDASVLAALASLRHYRKPQVQFSSTETSGPPGDSTQIDGGHDDDDDDDNNNTGLPSFVPSTVKEATPLPLHHTPLSISFGLIPGEETTGGGGGGSSSSSSSIPSSSSIVIALIDPSDREELVQSGSLTIAMNIHSEVCLLDYGGGCELVPNKLRECWKIAESAIKDLCRLLEASLAEADEQAQTDQLKRLKLQRQLMAGLGNADDFIALSLPPLPPSDRSQTPYLQEMGDIEELQVADSTIPDSTELSKIHQAQTEAEEAYRKQALDYSINHIPSAVRDNDAGGNGGQGGRTSLSSAQRQAGSLLASMLQSIGHSNSKSTAKESNSEGEQQHFDSQTRLEAATEVKPVPNRTQSDAKKYKATVKEFAAKEVAPMDLDGGGYDDDDEEEPATMMLESEFGTENAGNGPTKAFTDDQPSNAASPEDDADIDDFAMAIKSKSSKSKKKKSKKK